MEFYTPTNWIYFLLLIIIIIFLIKGSAKKEKILKYFQIKNEKKIKKIKMLLMIMGIFFIVFSLLTPRIKSGVQKIAQKKLDIYILIDTSKSMLSRDIKPDRISFAKNTIATLISNLDGDEIGFIPFASSAYVQMPLTSDYDMANMFLSAIDTDMMPSGGTNIKAALQLAQNSFAKTYRGEKVIILITDGEEHNNDAISYAKTLKDIKVFTLGAGTLKGSLIPIGNNKYLSDKNGNYVLSKINIDTLKKIASETHGEFYMSDNQNIKKMIFQLNSLKKGTGSTTKNLYKELFQIFLSIGLILIVFSYLLKDRRIKL